MQGGERRATIVRGEVHFSVHKDASRPFVVTAGNVHVRAVGTAFNVHAGVASVEVLVTEGRVQLERSDDRSLALRDDAAIAHLLAAGEKALVSIAPRDRAGESDVIQIAKISDEEVRRKLAWQERRLEFDSTPLADVVAEFNRYNRIQLVVDDAGLASRPFTGAFRADGYDTFVALLEQNFGVRVTRESGRIHLARR
jgi:transmembrane sensor